MSIFLKYGNIIGEAADSNHRQWADVNYIKWLGVERKITSTTSTQGDRESSNANIKNLSIVRAQDKASPYYIIEACCGTGKEVQIALTKTGEGKGSDVFMLYTLKNVLITNYTTLATAQSETRPIERLDLSFVDIQMRYCTYNDDGVIVNPVAVGFNTATNLKA